MELFLFFTVDIISKKAFNCKYNMNTGILIKILFTIFIAWRTGLDFQLEKLLPENLNSKIIAKEMSRSLPIFKKDALTITKINI